DPLSSRADPRASTGRSRALEQPLELGLRLGVDVPAVREAEDVEVELEESLDAPPPDLGVEDGIDGAELERALRVEAPYQLAGEEHGVLAGPVERVVVVLGPWCPDRPGVRREASPFDVVLVGLRAQAGRIPGREDAGTVLVLVAPTRALMAAPGQKGNPDRRKGLGGEIHHRERVDEDEAGACVERVGVALRS